MHSALAIDLFACPDCRGALAEAADGLACTGCGRAFAEEDGILRLEPTSSRPTPAFYGDPVHERLRQGIDRFHAAYYAQGSASGWLENGMKRALLKLAAPAPGPVVDLGCGMGAGFAYLGKPANIIGIDMDMRLLRLARAHHPEPALVCCDLLSAPFKDGVFGTVFSIGVLEHIFDLEAFLAAVNRLMRAGGRFHVLIPTEGGLAWAAARRFGTAPTAPKLLGLSPAEYIHAMTFEHCNTVFAMESALNKYFLVEKRAFWPLRLPSAHLNLAELLVLRPRKRDAASC